MGEEQEKKGRGVDARRELEKRGGGRGPHPPGLVRITMAFWNMRCRARRDRSESLGGGFRFQMPAVAVV